MADIGDTKVGIGVSWGDDGVGVGKNVGILLDVVVVGTVFDQVVGLSHGFIFSVGIVGDVVGEEGDGVDGFMASMTIAILICVLSTLFQVVLVSDVQLGTNRVGRSVGEGDGKVGGIQLGTCVVGAADWEDGG